MAHMIKQIIQYSDGTETVIDYKANENGDAIETQVAEAVAEKEPETIEETVEEVSETTPETAEEETVEEIVIEEE